MFSLKNILLPNVRLSIKHFSSSALYITGDKAQNVFAVLSPYIDFDVACKETLKENIRLRKLEMDLDKIEKQWLFYKHIDETKTVLEYTKNEIGKRIAELLKEPEKNSEELKKLQTHAKLTKNEYKNIKEYLYGIEEMATLKVLSLPNNLHSRTPTEHPDILYQYLEPPSSKSDFHLQIALKKDLVQYTNPMNVFLKNDAAIFETAVTNYLNNFMLDSKFTQFSNSNFARSVVVEGCGSNFFNKNEIFTLENCQNDESNEAARTHLVGGASLYSFMAYFTKHTVQLGHFPMKYFTLGRNYSPVVNNDPSFFNLVQSSQVNCFVATKDNEEDMNKEFDELVALIKKFYKSLDYHFRLVYLPASKIDKNESLRLSVQMFSSHSHEYVEVAHISLFDNFISKRLLFNYNEQKERRFPKVMSGSMVNVQKLLACAMEYNDVAEKDLLCTLLKQYAPM